MAQSVPFLHVYKDGQMIDSVSLDSKASFVMGRHADCDLLVAHPSISRHHLEIQLLHTTQQVLLTDLESVHGTWINGDKVASLTPVMPKENDSIKLGASSRTFRIQWIPQASSCEQQSEGVKPVESVSSEHSKTENFPEFSSNMIHESRAESWKNDGDSASNLQRIGPTAMYGSTGRGLNAAGSFQNLQKANSSVLPPKVPPRRVPFAPLQVTGLEKIAAKSPPRKKEDARGKKIKEQAEEVQVARKGVENNSDRQKTQREEAEQGQASGTLWLRRCNSAPPPRLLTAPPPSAPPLPVKNVGLMNGEQVTAPPPSAPPLPVKLMGLLDMERSKKMTASNGLCRNMTELVESENVLDTKSIQNCKELSVLDEQGMKHYNEENGKLGHESSLSRASSFSGATEEDYPSDKENLPPPSRPSKMQGAIINWTKHHTAESQEGSSGVTEVSRRPFQPLFLDSGADYRPASSSTEEDSFKNYGLLRPQRKSSSVAQNLDRMLRKLKLLEETKQRRQWHIIVDTSCLVDSVSYRCLRQLEGIKETRLIIPKIVIRELDYMKRKDKPKDGPSRILKWIEACMLKAPSWIHVQSSSECFPVGATPPSSPHHKNSAFSHCGGLGDLMSPTNDDHVLDCALLFSRTVVDGQVAILTNDTALKIKAMAEGLICPVPTSFCESLLSPYSEQFLWAGSVAHGPSWTERPCHNNHSLTTLPATATSELKKRILISAARDIASKKHHVVEGLKNHCNHAQGLKVVLD